MPGIRFNPTEQVVAWQPPYQSATFLFTTPAALEVDLNGYVRVYQGPLIIGEIPITMKLVRTVETASVALDQQGEFRRCELVFASYSHRDTPVMEYFRRMRQRLGQKMLADIYDLRAGEHWADRLLEMIDQSAVFQLFWSKHSAASRYCRKEWEHALKYVESRERFIQPVYWEQPLYNPPPELADFHFQRVALPPLTQVQLVMARLRGALGRG
mgnify:CR=1 FL=1